MLVITQGFELLVKRVNQFLGLKCWIKLKITQFSAQGLPHAFSGTLTSDEMAQSPLGSVDTLILG